MMAALEARKKGAEVLILCKKETARSGCTPYAVTNITRSTPESEEELFRQMVEVGGWLNDQEILDVFVREVATVIPSLSLIERMSTERAPVAVFAPRSEPARAYRALWSELR